MFVRRLALALAALAGLIGSQAPEFAQQYRQRLGGAVAELNRIISEFDAEAERQNLTPAEGLSRLDQNADPLARQRGEAMVETINRANRLNEQLQAMTSAGPLKRLYVMAKDFDPQIAESALDNYEPAAPLTFEALVAAGLAALSGWAATHLIAWPLRRRSRLRAMRMLSEGARGSN
jgi:exonuclease VII large subunit